MRAEGLRPRGFITAPFCRQPSHKSQLTIVNCPERLELNKRSIEAEQHYSATSGGGHVMFTGESCNTFTKANVHRRVL